jgi:hypothetical protein
MKMELNATIICNVIGKTESGKMTAKDKGLIMLAVEQHLNKWEGFTTNEKDHDLPPMKIGVRTHVHGERVE